MASNDALKATPAEKKKSMVAALMRERTGYERRLAGAQSEGNDKLAGAMEDRIDQVNIQLRHFGENAAAPARRSEKRPAVSARGAESR